MQELLNITSYIVVLDPLVLLRQVREGVPAAGQVQGRQEEDQGEEAHPQPHLR